MNKIIKILIVVFAIQLLLTAGFFYRSGIISSPPEKKLLLNLDKNNIKKIVLTGPGNKEVVLERNNEVWSLPNKNYFPANNAQITQLLDRLLETEFGAKISQQESSHTRLRVSESGFERKVSLSSDTGLTSVVYFGSAPSLRQSHARISKSADVHVVKFSANDIDVQPNDWLKKDIFTISSQDIKSVAFEKITLTRVSDENDSSIDQASSKKSGNNIPQKSLTYWNASGMKDKKLSNNAAMEFINKISDMRIDGIASESAIDKLDKTKRSKKYVVVLKDDKKIIYELAKLKDEEDFLFFTSQREGVFRLPPLSGKDLISSSTYSFLAGEPKKNIDD